LIIWGLWRGSTGSPTSPNKFLKKKSMNIYSKFKTKTMEKQLLLIVLLLRVCTMHAQQINTSSGSTQKNEFSAEWIIGGSLIDNSVFSAIEETTGFEIEVASIDLIEVHPTATRDFLKITSKNATLTTLNYKITNVSGVDFLNGNFIVTNPFELDVINLAAGYYLIIFSLQNDKTFMVTKKFIKL
jgi:hypothetical protein